MTSQQLLGWFFVIGSVLGCLSMLLSVIWHKLDNNMAEFREETGHDVPDYAASIRRRQRFLNFIRQAGLVTLYLGLAAMIIAAAGLGINMIEGKA